jgi:hypothetical protein
MLSYENAIAQVKVCEERGKIKFFKKKLEVIPIGYTNPVTVELWCYKRKGNSRPFEVCGPFNTKDEAILAVAQQLIAEMTLMEKRYWWLQR